jgi:hypothetical protein
MKRTRSELSEIIKKLDRRDITAYLACLLLVAWRGRCSVSEWSAMPVLVLVAEDHVARASARSLVGGRGREGGRAGRGCCLLQNTSSQVLESGSITDRRQHSRKAVGRSFSRNNKEHHEHQRRRRVRRV